ncbi:hypothetical protein X975_12033, partial [Stegodyphus mimosarum]
MNGLILGTLQLVWLVTGTPLDSGRYLIDSRPIHFIDEPDTESHIINSTIILKKKTNSAGPIYYESRKPEYVINNHHVRQGEGAVWKRPHTTPAQSFSNHKGNIQWKKWGHIVSSTTTTSKPTHGKISVVSGEILINNHNSNKLPNARPMRPASVVSVVDTSPAQSTITDVLGDRIKQPDIIKSAAISVLDAPSNLKTTIKHNKIIVIQKRTDNLPQNQIEEDIQISTEKPTKPPDMGNFSVAPVMDPWSNIPIPSRPSWSLSPIKGGINRPAAPQTVVPNLPFMPFLSTLITPLLSKPITPSALNSGMQGIKAMQGFLRNSLMGAMFCFLPSAFIALSLTATQRG